MGHKELTVDPILFVMSIVAAGIAGAAILLPSDTHRGRRWDEDELRDQLGAGSR